MQRIDEEELKRVIANRIKSCREEKGITQTDLAIQVGKAKTTIATWEQARSMPDAETFLRLARYFNKTLDYLYGESDK